MIDDHLFVYVFSLECSLKKLSCIHFHICIYIIYVCMYTYRRIYIYWSVGHDKAICFDVVIV